MPPRLKKLIGTILFLIVLPIYIVAAMILGEIVLPGHGFLMQALYYMVAGLAWVLPAGVLVTWMYRNRS